MKKLLFALALFCVSCERSLLLEEVTPMQVSKEDVGFVFSEKNVKGNIFKITKEYTDPVSALNAWQIALLNPDGSLRQQLPGGMTVRDTEGYKTGDVVSGDILWQIYLKGI